MWFLGDIISDFFWLNKNRELKKKVSDGTNGEQEVSGL